MSDADSAGRVPAEHLIEDIQRVAEAVGHPPSAREMNEHGNHSPTTVHDRFGSWSRGVTRAGFDPTELPSPGPERQVGDMELIDDVRRVAREVDGVPTVSEYLAEGSHPPTTVVHRFGSWHAALDRAGLDPVPARPSDSDLLDALEGLSDTLGHTPTAAEMADEGPHSPSTYRRRFGSWRAALDAGGHVRDACGPRISDEELLCGLARLNECLDHRPTTRDMDADGPHHSNTYLDRFGSWWTALELAGIED